MTDNAAVVEAATNILVALDLLDDVINDVESHSAEQAVIMHDAIGQLIARCSEAQAALELHMLRVLEAPIPLNGNVYKTSTKKEKVRYDHEAIAKGVVQHAVLDKDTGEAFHDLDAVRRAVAAMRDIYTTPSTHARPARLPVYDIPTSQVTSIEWGRKFIAVIPERFVEP